MRKALLLFGLFSFGWSKQTNPTSEFKPGQRWLYNTRPQENGSTVLILKIDQEKNNGTIIHARLDGLKLKNPNIDGGYSGTVGHLPISEKAFKNSITKMASENNKLPTEYFGGYQSWKQEYDAGNAGVFALSLNEIVNFIENTLNN